MFPTTYGAATSAGNLFMLTGEQGTGKTTATARLASIVDRSPVWTRKPPRDVEAWTTAAAGSWVVALDNLSDIPWNTRAGYGSLLQGAVGAVVGFAVQESASGDGAADAVGADDDIARDGVWAGVVGREVGVAGPALSAAATTWRM